MRKEIPVEVTPERLHQEHLEINLLEGHLLRAFADRCETPARLEHLLEQLKTRLYAHFGDEERGVIHQLAEGRPNLEARCQTLCRDHDQLRAAMEELLVMVNRLEGTPNWWDALEAKFRRLNQAIDCHEHAEQELLAEALG